MKIRLDKYLVPKIFISRTKAQEAISKEEVLVNNKPQKANYLVDDNDEIIFVGQKLKYVSRAGLKLETAIETFVIDFNNKIVLDVGASTGGFTDCALQNGAKLVYAVDVGSCQLHDKLKNDTKVISLENTDIRKLNIKNIAPIDIITIDVSFISLSLIMPFVMNIMNENTIVIALIKPQFECGKIIAKKNKGVIKDETLSYKICNNVLIQLRDLGLNVSLPIKSKILGADGNIEYLVKIIKNKNS